MKQSIAYTTDSFKTHDQLVMQNIFHYLLPNIAFIFALMLATTNSAARTFLPYTL